MDDNKAKIIGVDVAEETKQNIYDYISQNNIPNPINIDTLHTTLLYTVSNLFNYYPITYNIPIVGLPLKFEKWPTQPTDNKVSMCLVLRVDCPTLQHRHQFLLNQHDVTHTFNTYNPHITLSYDVGSFQVSTLSPFNSEIIFTNEFMRGWWRP